MRYDSYDMQEREYADDLETLKRREIEANQPELNFIKLFIKLISWIAYFMVVYSVIYTFLRVI